VLLQRRLGGGGFGHIDQFQTGQALGDLLQILIGNDGVDQQDGAGSGGDGVAVAEVMRVFQGNAGNTAPTVPHSLRVAVLMENMWTGYAFSGAASVPPSLPSASPLCCKAHIWA
jgi:hypothetical protein